MNGKSLTFLYFTSSILRSKASYLIFDIGMWLKQHTITYGMVGLSTFPMLCGGIWKPALGTWKNGVGKSYLYCKIGGNGNIILKYKYT